MSVLAPSVLWRCWLGGRKGIRPVKTEWWGAGMVICLEPGADLHMPSWCHCHSLSLASVKSRLVLPFWYRLTWVVPDKEPLNGCVCAADLSPRTTESDVSASSASSRDAVAQHSSSSSSSAMWLRGLHIPALCSVFKRRLRIYTYIRILHHPLTLSFQA